MEERDDRADILELLAAYCRCCDDGRLDELRTLFADDAVLVLGERRYEGVEAVGAFFDRSQGPSERRGKHLTMNAIVQLGDGSQRATAESDFVFLMLSEGTPVIVNAGRYRDQLVRVDDRWRFAQREIDIWE